MSRPRHFLKFTAGLVLPVLFCWLIQAATVFLAWTVSTPEWLKLILVGVALANFLLLPIAIGLLSSWCWQGLTTPEHYLYILCLLQVASGLWPVMMAGFGVIGNLCFIFSCVLALTMLIWGLKNWPTKPWCRWLGLEPLPFINLRRKSPS